MSLKQMNEFLTDSARGAKNTYAKTSHVEKWSDGNPNECGKNTEKEAFP
jgi:hypothetical protein